MCVLSIYRQSQELLLALSGRDVNIPHVSDVLATFLFTGSLKAILLEVVSEVPRISGDHQG